MERKPYYKEFHDPYPAMTTRALEDIQTPCRARYRIGSYSWVCTREKGHKGLHEAGIGEMKVAEWADLGYYEQFEEPGVAMPEEQPPHLFEQCRDGRNGWICTRRQGHDGLHMAGRMDGSMIAQWADEAPVDEDFFRAIGL